MRLIALTPLVVATLALAGCDSGDARPDYTVKPSIIRYGTFNGAFVQQDDARVVINGTVVSDGGLPIVDPATDEPYPVSDGPVPVRAGVPFDVTVWPSSGYTGGPFPSVVTASARSVTVAPRDSFYTGGDIIAVESFNPRTDRVTLTERGAGEVVIKGRRMATRDDDPSALDGDGRAPYEIRYAVVVE